MMLRLFALLLVLNVAGQVSRVDAAEPAQAVWPADQNYTAQGAVSEGGAGDCVRRALVMLANQFLKGAVEVEPQGHRPQTFGQVLSHPQYNFDAIEEGVSVSVSWNF
ncbi:hypothetical protein EUZ85_24555 [Hahella sp. KA22]|uniref:hypothetical protein n=1 Tax=Hahella sp. KA22 TaxID=1628392 RepID=UPI000FDE2D84|nr:hypothetical protein [Hahella sp. KA22]AZZ93718.1 hypothetical protein ENC22_21970 [Hahella sp. KA22]QAY57093.1 hypothetical protein EUZ85_24555 [Hahella sp. KA22]